MSKYSQCPKCTKKGYYTVYGYDPNPEKGELKRCRYCGHSVRVNDVQEYRGYTLTITETRKGPTGENRHDGLAIKGEDEESRIYVVAQLSEEDVFKQLRNRVDYFEGVAGLEEKTNEELAQYLADDILSDLKVSLTDAQARFLLEIADRLRGNGPVAY
jgi:hypothetical protein